jgi:hypothetical protein
MHADEASGRCRVDSRVGVIGWLNRSASRMTVWHGVTAACTFRTRSAPTGPVTS